MIRYTRFKCQSFHETSFLLVKKLSIQVGLILLKHVGSDIKVQSSSSAINSLNFGLFVSYQNHPQVRYCHVLTEKMLEYY